jgi:hypothetical protein
VTWLSSTRDRAQPIGAAGAVPDDPVRPMLPESAYLNAQVLQFD